ncbi:MAG: helix-turn-helix domain-containing protein [Clostridia bacterium]|nr:helix-turn-helix domain-containing protein [Clostridia bacterium]
MNTRINQTKDGVKTYPLHTHNHYEIMLYIEGNGQMLTKKGNIPFSIGTIIIVPPKIEHGSTSKNGFKNISIGGSFEAFFSFEEPVVLSDTPSGEGKTLATLIYDNRFNSHKYLQVLISAYLHFLLQNIKVNKQSENSIKKIIFDISNRFSDSELNLSALLQESGYAEDYARALFKEMTGKTPIRFLTEIRIKHACFLIDVYANSLSLAQIAEQCGYLDYVYFSKQFKEIMGISPREYKNTN